jgi:hypothetical protein
MPPLVEPMRRKCSCVYGGGIGKILKHRRNGAEQTKEAGVSKARASRTVDTMSKEEFEMLWNTVISNAQ